MEEKEIKQLEAEWCNPQFLVRWWVRALTVLEKFSVFNFVGKGVTKLKWNRVKFVEWWLVGNFLFALGAVFLIALVPIPKILAMGIALYGFLRVFEIFIYQLNVMFVHPFKQQDQKKEVFCRWRRLENTLVSTDLSGEKRQTLERQAEMWKNEYMKLAAEKERTYDLVGYRRMTIALIHNFFEIVLWFGVSYLVLQLTFDHPNTVAFNPFVIIYYSFLTTVSYSNNLSTTSWTVLASSLLHFQAVIGLFMTVISFARFVSLFPIPGTKDRSEQVQSEEIDVLMKELQEIKKQLHEQSK